MGPPLAVKGNVPQFSRPEAGLPTRKLHCGSRAAKSGQAGYTSALNWSLQAPTVVFPPRPQKNGLEDSSTTTSRWPSLRATLTRAWRSSSEPSRNANDPSRAQGPRRPARSRCYRPLAFASRSAIMGQVLTASQALMTPGASGPPPSKQKCRMETHLAAAESWLLCNATLATSVAVTRPPRPRVPRSHRRG